MSSNRITLRLIGNPFGLLIRLFYVAALLQTIRVAGQQPINELLPDQCPENPRNNITAANEYFLYPNVSQITATNLTNIEKFCTRKTEGRSKGRICCWNDNWNFMKYEFNDMRLLEYYQSDFVRNNLNAYVPESKFLLVDNSLLLSTSRVKNFKSAVSYYKRPFNQTNFREIITSQIGEKGVAKLFSVSTWIGDIGLENWGFTPDHGKLIFIDVDGGKNKTENIALQPRTLRGYLDLARNSIWHDKTSLPLSLNNIRDLKAIYVNMRNLTPPVIHPAVDLSINLYQAILIKFIEFCENGEAAIKRENMNVTDDYNDHHHNEILGWQINEIIKKLHSESTVAPAISTASTTQTDIKDDDNGPFPQGKYYEAFNGEDQNKKAASNSPNTIIPLCGMGILMGLLLAAVSLRKKSRNVYTPASATVSETKKFFKRGSKSALSTTPTSSSKQLVIKIAR